MLYGGARFYLIGVCMKAGSDRIDRITRSRSRRGEAVGVKSRARRAAAALASQRPQGAATWHCPPGGRSGRTVRDRVRTRAGRHGLERPPPPRRYRWRPRVTWSPLTENGTEVTVTAMGVPSGIGQMDHGAGTASSLADQAPRTAATSRTQRDRAQSRSRRVGRGAQPHQRMGGERADALPPPAGRRSPAAGRDSRCPSP